MRWSTTSFSRVPPPMAPGSSPPCPGSSAMMIKRSVVRAPIGLGAGAGEGGRAGGMAGAGVSWALVGYCAEQSALPRVFIFARLCFAGRAVCRCCRLGGNGLRMMPLLPQTQVPEIARLAKKHLHANVLRSGASRGQWFFGVQVKHQAVLISSHWGKSEHLG